MQGLIRSAFTNIIRCVDGQNTVKGVKGTTEKDSRDIGGRENIIKEKEPEKALERERMTLKGIIESTDTLIAYLDLNFNFVVVNSAYAKASGHSIDELIGKNHFELFPNKENQAIFERVRDTGEPVKFLDKPFEFADQPQRGVTYWDWTLFPLKDEEGTVQGLVLSLMETTERKKAEKALRESEERLNLAQKIGHVGSWEYYTEEDKAFWSDEMFNIFGLEPQLYGPDVTAYVKLIHPDDREKVNTTMEKVLFKGNVGDKASFDYRILRQDGSLRILHSERMIREVDQDGKSTRIMGVEQDITERKKAEDALRESEERFRVMADGTPSMLWVADVHGRSIFVNRCYKEFFGVTFEQANGSKWQPLVHPEDAPLYVGKFFESLHEHKPFFGQARVRRCDGEWRWIESYATPRFSADDEFLGHVGISIDITERKKAEDALRESEERFKLVAEAANVMVYETDVSKCKAKIIRGSQELIGYDPDEVDFTVDWLLSRIHPDDAPNVLAQFKAAAEISDQENYSIEYRFRHKDGHYIIVKDTARAVRDSTGKTVRLIGGVRDITERRKNEERIEQYSKHLEKLVEERTKQLINSERFAAIGKVTGMVGHDIRNPLQAIVSSTYLAKSDLEVLPDSLEKNDALQELKYIEEQLTYIDKIIKDLQDYSKPLRPEFTEVDINLLVASSLATISIPTNIEASTEIRPEIAKLKLDPLFFRRIIENLITNAIQAMPNGGKLIVSGYKKEDKAFISVEDTGVGIPEDVKPKLFTPMMTTKSKGQGLGLAVVRRLIEAQGGKISFESQEGKGTKFIMEFPLNR